MAHKLRVAFGWGIDIDRSHVFILEPLFVRTGDQPSWIPE